MFKKMLGSSYVSEAKTYWNQEAEFGSRASTSFKS